MSKHFSKLRGTTLGLDDQFGFGRHLGYTVLEVVKDRPQYIKWLIDNTGIRFYPSVIDELVIQLKANEPDYRAAYYKGFNYHADIDDWQGRLDWDDDVPF